MSGIESQVPYTEPVAAEEAAAHEVSLCGRAKHALGAMATALLVADKGVLLRNLANIKPL